MQVLCVKASLQLAVPPEGENGKGEGTGEKRKSSSKDRAMSVASSVGLWRHERSAGKIGRPLHGDDDLASSVPRPEVADRFRHIAQRIPRTDHGRHLTGLYQALEHEKIFRLGST